MNEVRHKVRHHATVSVPKLTLDHRGRYYVSFLLNGKRHRFANGRALDIPLDPNRLDPSLGRGGRELCYLIHGKLREGWGAEVDKDEIRALDAVRSFTVDPAFTTMYTKALQLTQRSSLISCSEGTWRLSCRTSRTHTLDRSWCLSTFPFIVQPRTQTC